jgi:hypothetical protein
VRDGLTSTLIDSRSFIAPAREQFIDVRAHRRRTAADRDVLEERRLRTRQQLVLGTPTRPIG